MRISVKPGEYILAVSGGVDSMVLLDLLAKKPDIELAAAHFNHGIRPDAGADEDFVKRKAGEYGIDFAAGRAKLGKNASEETARLARYNFLNEVRNTHCAAAIITAHHQDDMIETALLNILRGTNYKGLVAIKENKKIIRPLLGYSKNQLLDYARANKLEWREDATNSDTRYLRNYLRRHILNGLSAQKRQNLICELDKIANNSQALTTAIARLSQEVYKDETIDRTKFTSLPADVGNELIAYWLRERKVRDFNKTNINRLNTHIRTAKPGSSQQIKDNLAIKFSLKSAQFYPSVQ